MKRKLMLDGFHQYTMQIYTSLVNSGFSEIQAKAEVTKFLLHTIKYFDQEVKITTSQEAFIKEILGRDLSEEELYRLNTILE